MRRHRRIHAERAATGVPASLVKAHSGGLCIACFKCEARDASRAAFFFQPGEDRLGYTTPPRHQGIRTSASLRPSPCQWQCPRNPPLHRPGGPRRRQCPAEIRGRDLTRDAVPACKVRLIRHPTRRSRSGHLLWGIPRVRSIGTYQLPGQVLARDLLYQQRPCRCCDARVSRKMTRYAGSRLEAIPASRTTEGSRSFAR